MRQDEVRSAAPEGGDVSHEQNEQFAIAAPASLLDVRPLVLKHGDCFAVFDSKGDVRLSPSAAGPLLPGHPAPFPFRAD